MIGYGPLPRAGMEYVAAPALRTRHFLKPVLDAGHTISLFTLPLSGTEGPESEVAAIQPDTYEGIAYQRFSNHNGEFAIRTLNDLLEDLAPEAIVGVNTYPSYVAALLGSTIPVWADLNGYWMAEMQGRCRTENSDAHLADAWAIERSIVRRCDKFSAVSRPQLHAVIGEMAGVGRLNQYTFHYQFGHHIPNAAYRWPEPPADADPPQPVVRGPRVPPESFIILWSGGFNVWADIPTMVRAIDMLMDQYPTVHFVTTGGAIRGYVSRPYEQYRELVEQSSHRERYHDLGWIDSDRLRRVYREANIGINVDSRNYETLFGARNRINAMAAEGLPVVSTLGTEVTEWLHDAQALLTTPLGDPAALAHAIEPWIEQAEGLRMFAERAEIVMREDFSYEVTTQPLLDWLDNPRLAPDNQAKLDLVDGRLSDLNAVSINELEEEALLLLRHGAQRLRELADEDTARREQRKRRRGLFGRMLS